jgi:hypothetical protein
MSDNLEQRLNIRGLSTGVLDYPHFLTIAHRFSHMSRLVHRFYSFISLSVHPKRQKMLQSCSLRSLQIESPARPTCL